MYFEMGWEGEESIKRERLHSKSCVPVDECAVKPVEKGKGHQEHGCFTISLQPTQTLRINNVCLFQMKQQIES